MNRHEESTSHTIGLGAPGPKHDMHQPVTAGVDTGPAPVAVDIFTAAKMLSVCHVTVRREIERNELRAVKIGRVWRIRVAELHAYLKRKEDALT